MRADRADLGVRFDAQSLPRHRNNSSLSADADVVPEFARAQSERPRLRQFGEREHFCRVRFRQFVHLGGARNFT